MEEGRPNPEQLLKQIEDAKRKQSAGKLRIFFGYAAGVGKTYHMLLSAHKRKAEGVDVVIGYLEPHARPETMALGTELESVPLKEIDYHGILLKEMDVDGILKRKPKLVLVDEYAHTNAKGSRHNKRYQDVEELLAAGIDVYTTVNVQHIESLCDKVASITGILVRERIPDHAFDLADEVKLVDVEPEVLLQRLKDGKIYRRDQAGRAMENFFTLEKLRALREIALRRMADRVNHLAEKERTSQQYCVEEKILIGISPSPSNPKIIRAAARMAQAFGGQLIALYVETPGAEKLGEENKKRLKDNLHLAEQLGAKLETISGEDVPFLIAEYARTSGISKIVAGRSMPKKGLLHRPTYIDKLTAYAPEMDIYIIPDGQLARAKQKKYLEEWEQLGRKNLRLIGGSFLLAAAAYLGFSYYQPDERILFVITFLGALVAGCLMDKMQSQAKEIAKAAYRTKTILDITQNLLNKNSIEEIGNVLSEEISKLLRRPVIFYEAQGDQLVQRQLISSEEISPKERAGILQDNERAVAQWVYKNNTRAGATTGTLNNAMCYYLAVRNMDTVYGVIGIRIKAGEELTAFESNILMVVLGEAGVHMEQLSLRSNLANF